MREFMADFYYFQKKYWNVKEDQEFFDDLLKEAAELNEKHGCDPYFFSLIAAFLDRCDSIAKQMIAAKKEVA